MQVSGHHYLVAEDIGQLTEIISSSRASLGTPCTSHGLGLVVGNALRYLFTL